MSCTKISKTNKAESSLFNTIYNGVANKNEQLATFYYNWFNTRAFDKLFGFNYVDEYKKALSNKESESVTNERVDENGEPKLFYNEDNKQYYFLNKDNEKVYFPLVNKGLSQLWTQEQIKNVVSRLLSSYIKRNTKISFNNIDFSDLKSLPSIEKFIVFEINKKTKQLEDSGEFGKAMMLEEALTHVDELHDLIIQKFKDLSIDVDEDVKEESENEEDTRENQWGKSSFSRSTKSKISANIKLRLSLISDPNKKDEIFDDNVLIDFNEIHSKLLQILGNTIPSEGEDLFQLYLDKIQDLSNHFPYLKELYKLLQNNKDENFRNEFVQSYYLGKNNFINEKYSITNEGVKQESIDLTNRDDALTVVKNTWLQNFNTLFTKDGKVDATKYERYSKFFNTFKEQVLKASVSKDKSNPETIKAYKDLVLKTLKNLGIVISDNAFDYYLNDVEGIEEFNAINKLANQLDKYVISKINSEGFNLFNSTDELNKLVRAQAFLNSDMSDPNLRIAGNKRWLFSNPSHLHTQLERWKKNPEILLKEYEEDQYTQGSKWIKEWFELDNTELTRAERLKVAKLNLAKVKLGVLGEITFSKNGKDEFKETTDLSYKDYLLNNINSVLKKEGFVRTITQADKSTEFVFKTLIDRIKGFVGYNSVSKDYKLTDEVKQLYFDYYLSEIRRMIKAKNTVLDAFKDNSIKLTPHYHYNYKDSLEDNKNKYNLSGNAFKSQYFNFLNPGEAKTNIEKNIVNLLYKNGKFNVDNLDYNLESQLETLFFEYFEKSMTPEINNTINEMLNLGIIKIENGKYSNKLLDVNLIESYTESKTPEGIHLAIYKVASDYLLNGISNNIEFTKLFTGDVAYFKDAVDFKKRIPATYTDGKYLVLKEGEADFNVATINAVKIDSPFLSELKKEGVDEEVLKMLSNINSTDGQAWITPERWKFLKVKLGQWSPVHDSLYAKMQSGKDEQYTKDELKAAAQPVKGVYFYKINGKPTYLKYSQAVLSKALVRGTDLESLLQDMYDNKIDELLTFDAIKVGSIEPTTIHNPNNALLEKRTYNVQTLSNYGWKLQQDLPTKNYKSTDVGSQIQKNIFAGIKHYFENKNFKYRGNNISGKEINDLLVDTVGQLSDIGYNNLIQKAGIDKKTGKITNNKKFYKALIDELKSRGGSENVVKALEAETVLFGIPQTTGKLFEIFASMINKNIVKIKTNGGSFIQMADFGLSYDNIDKANSGIKFNPNIKGLNPPMIRTNPDGSKTVTPGSVFVPASFIAKYIPNWKEYSAEALFIGENGNPPIIDTRITENIIGYRIPNQGLPSNDSLQIAGILPESTGDTIIAYVGITSKTGSDYDIDKMYIMFPQYETKVNKESEIYTQIENSLKGKTNTETLNNYKNFIDKFTEVDSDLLNEDFVEKYNSLSKEEGLTYLRSIRTSLIDLVVENLSSNTVKNQFPNIKFEVTGLKYSTTGDKGVQNKLIEIYKSVLTNPEVYDDIMKSIDNDFIKEEINMLKKESSTNFMESFDPIEDIKLRYSFLGGKAGVGMEANALTDIWRTGVLTIQNLFNFKWGNFKDGVVELDKEYSEELSEEDINYYMNAVGKNDKQKANIKKLLRKIKIGETIGTILNAFVDIAKDPYISKGNWTTSTTNVGNLMIRMGVHPLYVVNFLANPIISEYIQYQQDNEGLFDNNSGDTFNKFKNYIIQKKLGDKKIGGNPLYSSLYIEYFNSLNVDYLIDKTEDLVELTKLKGNKELAKKAIVDKHGEEVYNDFLSKATNYHKEVFFPESLNLYDRNTNQYNKFKLNLEYFRNQTAGKDSNLNFQITLLNEFRNLQDSSKFLKQIVDFGKLDVNGIGKDPNNIFYLEDLLYQIQQNSINTVDQDGKDIKGIIKGFESKLDNTILSKYYNNLLKIKDVLESNPGIFPLSSENVRSVFNKMILDMGKTYSSKEETYEIISRQFKTYIYNKLFNISDSEIKDLDNNLALEVDEFKKNNAGKYFIIDNLNNVLGDLQLNNSERSLEFQRMFTESWEELFEDHPELAEKLVHYSFIKTGFNMTRSQFYSYIPYQYFIRKNVNNKINDIFRDSTFDEFENKFYLNNLTDTKIVKRYKDNEGSIETYLAREGEKGKLLFVNKSKHFNNPFIEVGNEYYKYVGENNNGNYIYVQIKNEPTSNNYNVELDLYDFNTDLLAKETIEKEDKVEETFEVETKQEVKPEIVSKTSIQMQPQNVEKILNGTKTTTIRESIPKGGNIAVGETKIVNFGGKDFYVTNRGHLTIQEAGGLENMLKSEGLKSIDDFMYNQSKNWAKGNGKMYVFDIKESFEVETTSTKKVGRVVFEEEKTSGYANRTKKNASADATIAIAIDFNTAGEKLTKKSVESQGKKYIPIDLSSGILKKDAVEKIVEELNSVNASTLNIAGNGIYTFKDKTQEYIDEYVYDLLNQVLNSPNLTTTIRGIRTGGQTGIDEAGTKAGIKLGLPTLTLAPKNWTFRNKEGKDISNEVEFKERFGEINKPEQLSLFGNSEELWKTHQSILEDNGMTQESFTELYNEMGEDYINEYIKKCKS